MLVIANLNNIGLGITAFLLLSNNLAYLLLVGDITQIPSKSLGGGWSSGESDNWYAYMSGNDSYPEFFVGRFSAENLSHVNTQAVSYTHLTLPTILLV